MLGVGATFAGYRLERQLGQGGMGTVYLARHPRLPRSVALKLLNREVCADAELQRRFEQEADLVSQLDHPGIVDVYDRGTEDGHLWIAMQYVRGTDANSWDARANPPATTARLLGQTAAALEYAHHRSVLHRDVKPANILVTDLDGASGPRAVLTDFGIARLTTADTRLTMTGTFTATIAYASPEQLSGTDVDHRGDQYSLACTFFALMAGRSPYASTNPGQVVVGHLSQPVPRLTDLRRDLPPAVDTVLARAMAKHRDERYAGCVEFTDELRRVLEGGHVAAPLTPAAGYARPGTVPDASRPTPAGGHLRQAPVPGRPQPTPAQGFGLPVHGQGFAHPAPVAQASPGPAPSIPGAAQPIPFAAPYPGYTPYPHVAPGRTPSAATAMFAAVTILLWGLAIGAFEIYGAIETARIAGDPTKSDELPGSIVALVVLTVAFAVSVFGGGLLLAGRTTGRVLTALAALAPLLLSVVGVIGVAVDGTLLSALLALVPAFLLALAVLVCACHPATGRWIAYRRARRLHYR
ncbi:protein kinase domain-containing protein [Nocardia thailandica]